MEIYIIKVKDYTTEILCQYDPIKNEYFVQRGDGTKYTYSNNGYGGIEWVTRIGEYPVKPTWNPSHGPTGTEGPTGINGPEETFA